MADSIFIDPGGGSGGGSGSVTSVALTATPTTVFDVSGSPVTDDGTLALTMDNQAANIVLAGPNTGAAAAPAFRALVTADLPANSIVSSLNITLVSIDGNPLPTGAQKVHVTSPISGIITSWRMLSAESTTTTLDIWKDTYTNYPPTVADTITAAAKPSITAAIKNASSTLTGWTTTITAGDIIEINIDSNNNSTKIVFTLFITLS